jgi:hypothetical protein
MTNQAAHRTRLERILGVRLAEDAVRQWPQSGERIDGRARIGEVESHFVGLRLGVGRRHALGDTIVVEWSTDYGDGRVYRNVSIAELRDGKAIRVTDYWGAPFPPPSWREALATPLDMPRDGIWPAADTLKATDTTARQLRLRQGAGARPATVVGGRAGHRRGQRDHPNASGAAGRRSSRAPTSLPEGRRRQLVRPAGLGAWRGMSWLNAGLAAGLVQQLSLG